MEYLIVLIYLYIFFNSIGTIKFKLLKKIKHIMNWKRYTGKVKPMQQLIDNTDITLLIYLKISIFKQAWDIWNFPQTLYMHPIWPC